MKRKVLNLLEIIMVLGCFYFQNMINFTNIELYIILVLLLVLFKNTEKGKNDSITTLFACIFSLFFSIGNLSIYNFGYKNLFVFIIQFVGWMVLLSKILLFLKSYVSNIVVDENKSKHISKYKFILLSMFFGFLAFLPYFLKFFPGIMSTDSFRQLWQATGYLPYSNHHPWIHTLIIKFFYSIGFGITGSPRVGVMFYTLFQMLVVSFVFSYVTWILYKNNVKKFLVVIVWAFFFLLPFNAIYSITMWKDIFFSLIVLFLSMFIFDIYNTKEDFTFSKKILFVLLCILLCLFRSNGLIVYFIFLIVMFVFYRKDFLKIKYPILITVIIVFVIKGPIMTIFNVSNPNFVESVSIPAQQIAYVIKTDGILSNDDISQLSKFIDIGLTKEEKKLDINYHKSDAIKANLLRTNNYIETHKGEFFKLWIKIGIKNPTKYIRAYVLQTSGYWYHNYGKFWVYYTDIKTTAAYYDINDYLYQTDLLPKMLSKQIDNALSMNLKIYYKTWSPAISFYVVILCLYFAIENKKNVLVYVPNIALVLTLLIATPVACEFRYAYAVFISAMPLLIVTFIKDKKIRKGV